MVDPGGTLGPLTPESILYKFVFLQEYFYGFSCHLEGFAPLINPGTTDESNLRDHIHG